MGFKRESFQLKIKIWMRNTSSICSNFRRKCKCTNQSRKRLLPNMFRKSNKPKLLKLIIIFLRLRSQKFKRWTCIDNDRWLWYRKYTYLNKTYYHKPFKGSAIIWGKLCCNTKVYYVNNMTVAFYNYEC